MLYFRLLRVMAALCSLQMLSYVLPGPFCDNPMTVVGGQVLEGPWCSGVEKGMEVELVSFPALGTSQKISLYRLFLSRGAIDLNNT